MCVCVCVCALLQVAAKLLKRSDEIALGDFRTEIAILRKIHHPNTTQFLGACTKQKPYIVITELMACSLADAFSRTFYAPSARRQVCVCVCVCVCVSDFVCIAV